MYIRITQISGQENERICHYNNNMCARRWSLIYAYYLFGKEEKAIKNNIILYYIEHGA